MTNHTRLFNAFLVAVIGSYILVSMEWLFFITKPSFLGSLTAFENASLLLLAPLPLAALAFVLFVAHWAALFMMRGLELSRLIPVAYLAVPACILTTSVFLLVENFTYTLFRFNIGSFEGASRNIYLLVIILVALWIGRKVHEILKLPCCEAKGRYIDFIILMPLFVAVMLCAVKFVLFEPVWEEETKLANRTMPNILVLSADGLDASHMSAYGYERNTTPFINSLVSQSLIAENHFTNNAQSTGSIGALFSGKLPTSTRVIFPPDIFRGIDAYQHMPGILKKLGYRNADFSMRHYTDPYDLNIREGFDLANGRNSGEISGVFRLPRAVRSVFMNESYFFEQVISRSYARFRHALSIDDMVNPYRVVTETADARAYFPDSKRIEQLIEFIDGSVGPFFAHVHLMMTHGPTFKPERSVFSLGQIQQGEWLVDFYDDAILSYDSMVQRVVSYLHENGSLDQTLVILTSDHGSSWLPWIRIPLLMRFPNQQFAGVRHNNVQRIDVTASIVEFLGIQKPEWMEGISFLEGEIEPNRLIFFASASLSGPGQQEVPSYEAPYYSLGGVGAIVAQRFHFWDLSTNQKVFGEVANHTAPHPDEDLPTNAEVFDQLAKHLQKSKYPVPGTQNGHSSITTSR